MALERRLGSGAKVALCELDEDGVSDVQELLGHYVDVLERSEQPSEAERVRELAAKPSSQTCENSGTASRNAAATRGAIVAVRN